MFSVCLSLDSDIMSKIIARQTRDVAVQGTNDSSIGSKFSMSNRGYFADDFVKYFAGKPCRRAPIINRGYYIRAAAVNHSLTTFLKAYSGCKTQIVNLGAGSDSSYFRLRSAKYLTNSKYVEVDFCELMVKKRDVIESEPQLLEMIGKPAAPVVCSDDVHNCIVLNAQNLKLLGVDLCRPDLLTAVMEAVGVDFCLPTLILSEVVLTYLPPARSSDVIFWAYKTFRNGVFVCYEQVHPNDPFGIFMCSHFESLGSPLRSIHVYETVASQVSRYIDQGWTHVAASDMNYFYNVVVSEDERSRVELLEPFDEFEEWHLKCAHYVLLTAFSGSCRQILSLMWPRISETNGDVVNSEVSDCGTFVCMSKHSCLLPASGNVQPLSPPNDCEVKEMDSVGGTMMVSSDVEQNQSSILRDTELSLWGTALCDDGLHWRAAQLAFIGDEIDSRCQRFGHTVNRLLINGQQCMAAVGGFGVASSGRHHRLSDVAVWNLSSMSAETYTVDSDYLLSRVCHATVTLGDFALPGNPAAGNSSLVVIGGRRSPTSPVCNDVVLVNFSDTKSVTCHTVLCSGDMPDPCWRHTVVHTVINGDESLIQFGGRGTSHVASNYCYILSCRSWVWRKVFPGGDIPEARHSHSADIWNGYMVIAGGLGSHLRPLGSVHMLDVRQLQWQQLRPQPQLVPRYSHTSAVYKDYLILVGGVSLSCLSPPVEMVHIVTGHSQKLELPINSASIVSCLAMLHHHAGVMLDDDDVNVTHDLRQNNDAASAAANDDDDDGDGDKVRLLIVGGGGNCFSFGTHFNRRLMMLTIRSCRPSAACSSADAFS